jgi:uncharacterized protein
MGERAETAFFMQTFDTAVWGFWRAGGLMLAGMALFTLGVFSAARSTRFYATLAAVTLTAGLPLVAFGVYRNFTERWDIAYSFFFGWQYNYWGSLLVSLGWVALFMLAYRAGVAPRVVRRLAAVGQLALSNYLLQSIICTTIFYGHGFGLFGSVERVGQLAIVFGVWAAQLTWSPVWLRYFQFGPAEWAWRSLTYGRAQPFRRVVMPDVVRTV